MSALQALETAMQKAEQRIENAAETEPDILRALTHGCGIAEGYYLAGVVSKLEYDAACTYLRRVSNQRRTLLDLKQQAIAEGIA